MLLREMQVLEVMKTHVVKTTPDATLSQAADLLDLYQTSGLPVIDLDDRLCGMLAESDVQRAVTEYHARAAGLFVREWMTTPAISLAEDAQLTDAISLMRSARLKRLPIVNAEGNVVGVLNRIDFIQTVFEGVLDDATAPGG